MPTWFKVVLAVKKANTMDQKSDPDKGQIGRQVVQANYIDP